MPECCGYCILDLFYDSLLLVHQVSIRTSLTIKQKLYIPHLMHYIRGFLKGCQTCEIHKAGSTPKDKLKTDYM